MLDIKFVRENKEIVKENIKKKFQDEKLPLVDEVFELDKRVREVQLKADTLKNTTNGKNRCILSVQQFTIRNQKENSE